MGRAESLWRAVVRIVITIRVNFDIFIVVALVVMSNIVVVTLIAMFNVVM